MSQYYAETNLFTYIKDFLQLLYFTLSIYITINESFIYTDIL